MMKIIHKNFDKRKAQEVVKLVKKYYSEGVKEDKSGIILQNIKRR